MYTLSQSRATQGRTSRLGVYGIGLVPIDASCKKSVPYLCIAENLCNQSACNPQKWVIENQNKTCLTSDSGLNIKEDKSIKWLGHRSLTLLFFYTSEFCRGRDPARISRKFQQSRGRNTLVANLVAAEFL